MKDITLAFSELAGRVGVEVSSADTPAKVADAIVMAFEGSQPLALSETEKSLSIKFREDRIERLRSKGVTPLVTNKLTAMYCQGEMAFSHSNDDFELVFDLLSDAWDQKLLLSEEKTGAQVPITPVSPEQAWIEKTRTRSPLTTN